MHSRMSRPVVSALVARRCGRALSTRRPRSGAEAAVRDDDGCERLDGRVRRRSLDAIVHLQLWYHVGSKNEKPGRTGFAHLFET